MEEKQQLVTAYNPVNWHTQEKELWLFYKTQGLPVKYQTPSMKVKDIRHSL